MKKIIIALCAFAFISTTFLSSCKKFVDGPAFSLRSKKARLQGDWKIESFSINDVDKTADFKQAYGENFLWVIEKDGHYKITGNITDEGTWTFGEDKDDAYFQSNVAGSTEKSFRILRLADTELWMRQIQTNGEAHKYKLKQ